MNFSTDWSWDWHNENSLRKALIVNTIKLTSRSFHVVNLERAFPNSWQMCLWVLGLVHQWPAITSHVELSSTGRVYHCFCQLCFLWPRCDNTGNDWWFYCPGRDPTFPCLMRPPNVSLWPSTITYSPHWHLCHLSHLSWPSPSAGLAIIWVIQYFRYCAMSSVRISSCLPVCCPSIPFSADLCSFSPELPVLAISHRCGSVLASSSGQTTK